MSLKLQGSQVNSNLCSFKYNLQLQLFIWNNFTVWTVC